jgi:hypothetical protein
MSTAISPSGTAWDIIEKEKQRDRVIRRVSKTAWAVTFVIVVAFAVVTGVSVAHMARLWAVGAISFSSVTGAAIPLLAVLGMLSVLIATLSTVGIFLRLRTASLMEIQLRLATLEEMLAARSDGAS